MLVGRSELYRVSIFCRILRIIYSSSSVKIRGNVSVEESVVCTVPTRLGQPLAYHNQPLSPHASALFSPVAITPPIERVVIVQAAVDTLVEILQCFVH